MTDSPTYGRRTRGSLSQRNRLPITAGQIYTPMNNSHEVPGFVLLCCASAGASRLRSRARKQSVKQPLDLMLEKDARQSGDSH